MDKREKLLNSNGFTSNRNKIPNENARLVEKNEILYENFTKPSNLRHSKERYISFKFAVYLIQLNLKLMIN